MDWTKLSFSYVKTHTMLVSHYQNGRWSEPESRTEDTLTLNALSASLQYGLQCFEGLKAFSGKDGKIRIFRPGENAQRLQSSAEYLGIPSPGKELFLTMVKRAVAENKDFIPPYATGGSLYIRPTLIGTGPQLGLYPSTEAMFFIVVNPVGSYGGKTLEPVNAVISREYDRAAPSGSGPYKIGGNYAAAMLASSLAQKAGYHAVLYLDPLEHKYIDEFSSSNFFAIKEDTYFTPLSGSILPSITNRSLEQIARDMGMKTERRPIQVEELAGFEEAGECGTAVVITPVWRIDDKRSIRSAEGVFYEFNHRNPDGERICGPKSRRLYERLTGIQYGETEDKHKWCLIL